MSTWRCPGERVSSPLGDRVLSAMVSGPWHVQTYCQSPVRSSLWRVGLWAMPCDGQGLGGSLCRAGSGVARSGQVLGKTSGNSPLDPGWDADPAAPLQTLQPPGGAQQSRYLPRAPCRALARAAGASARPWAHTCSSSAPGVSACARTRGHPRLPMGSLQSGTGAGAIAAPRAPVPVPPRICSGSCRATPAHTQRRHDSIPVLPVPSPTTCVV